MREVLIISLHFPPGAASGAFRIAGFARHLPSFGWGVSVVACPAAPFEPVDEQLTRNLPSSTNISYVNYPNGPLSYVMRRILGRTGVLDPHAIWCPTAALAGMAAVVARKPDVILTSGPPHSVHLIGCWLKRRYGIPLVVDFRDPWSTGASRSAMVFERYVLRTADGIIANAPQALAAMARAHPQAAEKMTVVPNGFDAESSAVQDTSRSMDGSIHILHAGELYHGRDPRGLFDAMKDVERAHPATVPWKVQFLGRTEGSGLDVLAEAGQRKLRSGVAVDGQVPYELAKQQMRNAGILLLMDGPGRRVGVPAKVYEYIGAGRPILALAEPDGDTAWALKESGSIYRLARPNDPVAIGQALLDISASARNESSSNAGGAESPFSRRRLTGNLSVFLEGAVSGNMLDVAKRQMAVGWV